MPIRFLLPIMLNLLLLASCGGGGSDSSSTPPTPPASVYLPPEGVILSGKPDDLALSVLTDMSPIPAQDADIENGLLLTRLSVGIAANATVAQVNSALEAHGGGIVGMLSDLPVLVVAVPRQGDAEALQVLANSLAAASGIRIAMLAREAQAELAPLPPADAEFAMRHLQDARFPAAWNVRRLAADCNDQPTVIAADFFTRPIPGNTAYADFAREVPGVDDNGIGGGGTSPNASLHGYDVLTTLAAALDDEIPTGANPFPDCLDIRTVQMKGLGGVSAPIAIALAIPASGKVIVNTSFGFWEDCSEPCLPTALHVAAAQHRAVEGAWVRAVLASRADRVLVSAAAGNAANEDISVVYPGVGIADYSSEFTVAAKADADMSFARTELLWEPAGQSCTGADSCFPSLTLTPEQLVVLENTLDDLGPASRTPSVNVLVVGSSQPVANNLPSDFSEPGEDVSAVGEGIPIMALDANQQNETTQGTSFAAPQVAALASYLWMISPELRSRPVTDTILAIRAGAFGTINQIDAYSSILSLDPAGDPDPATWLIRRSLLDVDDSNAFTEVDLAAFIARYFQAPDLVQAVDPQQRDYSRYDLNGDGYTGGATAVVSFDLDRNGSSLYGPPQLTEVDVPIGAKRFGVNEQFVSDLEVLCYYAYTALYTGDEFAREQLLANKCVPIMVVVAPAAITVAPGGTVNFAADVSGTTDPRVTWELPDGGGTISSEGVFTAGTESGTFRVRARSVVKVNRFGDAQVTVGAQACTGVTRITNWAELQAWPPDGSSDCGYRSSLRNINSYTETSSCSSEYAGTSTMTLSFTESYTPGGELVAASAEFSGSATGLSDMGANYYLDLRVTQTTDLTIQGTLDFDPQISGAALYILGGVGFVVYEQDPGPLDRVVTLPPGDYSIRLAGGGKATVAPQATVGASLRLSCGLGGP